MGWPLGKKLGDDHKARIRDGVLRTVKIRRRPRTREERLRDITEDPRSVLKRRFTKAPTNKARFMKFLASRGKLKGVRAVQVQAMEQPKHLGIPGLRPRASAAPMLLRHRHVEGA